MMPSRRLWIVPYQFLVATKRLNPNTKGNRAYLRFKDCLRRLQGTTIETTIKAGGRQITKAWSWIDSWEVHEEDGKAVGVEIVLSEWFFRRVVDDRSVLAIHTDYFLLTGGIERWLYRIARKHCGNNESGWSFTLHKLYEKYPPGREFRKFKHDLKVIVKLDCLPEYHTAWETLGSVDWVHFSLRQGTLAERKLPRSLRS
jgi:plasmid replication initiation protein